MRCRTLFAAGLLVSAGVAMAADPATIARAGAPGVAACSSCHGAAGEGQGSFPRLAGLDSAYLARQLDDFATGRRANAMMSPIAKALASADRQALAQHYARLPPPPAATAARGDPAGQRLAMRGAWAKSVPACVQCHGPGGRGVGAAFPALAGQSAAYISAQLKAFRDGLRKNDPQALMRAPASRLSDDEIAAVAQWFSVQPARRPGGDP